MRHSVNYICDIIPTMYDNTTLWVDYTTLGICMTSLRYRSCHIHSITPSHSLHDFTSTSGMTSHPLYQTLSILYLCHHNLSTDITPILYHITPIISVTSYTVYITSYPLFMSSNYCTYDSTSLTYETTSSMQFKIYTIPVTSQSLVCVITCTVLRASHPNFVWHHSWHR